MAITFIFFRSQNKFIVYEINTERKYQTWEIQAGLNCAHLTKFKPTGFLLFTLPMNVKQFRFN